MGIKVKSPKQGLTNAENLTIMLPESRYSPTIDLTKIAIPTYIIIINLTLLFYKRPGRYPLWSYLLQKIGLLHQRQILRLLLSSLYRKPDKNSLETKKQKLEVIPHYHHCFSSLIPPELITGTSPFDSNLVQRRHTQIYDIASTLDYINSYALICFKKFVRPSCTVSSASIRFTVGLLLPINYSLGRFNITQWGNNMLHSENSSVTHMAGGEWRLPYPRVRAVWPNAQPVQDNLISSAYHAELLPRTDDRLHSLHLVD